MNAVMQYICNIILLFFTFSVLGWCMEVILKYRQFHRFINRGFFVGPYLPIYGSGVALVTIILDGVSRFDDSYGMTFLISFFACGTLEYLVSYVLEKRFHARWWDYSRKPMNINGRVWIGNLILFGLGGTIVAKVIDPIFFSLVEKISERNKVIAAVAILVLLLIDYLVSHFVMKLLKEGIENSEADNTEAINKEMRELVTNRSYLHRRMLDAYPEVVYRTDRVLNRLKALKEETELLTREVKEYLNEQKENFVYNHEPAGMIKSSIIEDQTELILLLENGSDDQERMNVLRESIAEQKKQLAERDGVLTRLSSRVSVAIWK